MTTEQHFYNARFLEQKLRRMENSDRFSLGFTYPFGWAIGENEEHLKEILLSKKGSLALDSILAIFNKRPRWYAKNAVAVPPPSQLESMTPIDRMSHIAHALQRRKKFLATSPHEVIVQIGEQKLIAKIDHQGIPHGGVVGIDFFSKDKTRIGYLNFDIPKQPQKHLLIHEVQSIKPEDTDRETIILAEKRKKSIRNEMKRNRNVKLGDLVPHFPGLEEVMVVTARELLVQQGLVRRNDPVFIPQAAQTYSFQPGRDGHWYSYADAIKKAFTENPTIISRFSNEDRAEIRRFLHNQKWTQEADNFVRESGKLHIIADLLLTQVHAFYQTPNLENYIRSLSPEQAISYITMLTSSYLQLTAPYWTTFSDCEPEQTEYGRTISGTAIDQLPFMQLLQLKRRK